MTRSVEALVEAQARKWQMVRSERREDPRRPVITLSREHGARGEQVARRVAEELELDLFDREIIHRIAESTHLADQVVAALDEHDRELLTDWLASLASREYLSPGEYRYHLSSVIGAVARHGGALIMGRGAHIVLGRGEALRVLVVAPLEDRVRTIMRREGLSDRQARRRIVAVEADRRAFLMQHFRSDFGDPSSFDLVVNTAVLGVEGACRAISQTVPTLASPDDPRDDRRLTDREPRPAPGPALDLARRSV
jgi:Cytidylate kinase-like family